ncbi:type II toxin-antitoxin system VapB family antitoxin [Brevundimonas aurifodinae]|uniref:Type II toxin-antitoxin system VapB family antitoxin n=2 Tax=Brevundimonas TaxID=41275 RepID=A0ABV1NS29_9CAUL|nr:MAG: transcription factor [Brevundimonas sp. 12-68-7]OYX33950.1 MAG: transcription factor [Brevundimonas subvibrioides]
MPLYIKDPEVDRLAERLAAQRRMTKTEVVRQALRHELDRVGEPNEYVERALAFVRDLHARAGPDRGFVDKAFIDSLYD